MQHIYIQLLFLVKQQWVVNSVVVPDHRLLRILLLLGCELLSLLKSPLMTLSRNRHLVLCSVQLNRVVVVL